jgi:hypothetical protein
LKKEELEKLCWDDAKGLTEEGEVLRHVLLNPPSSCGFAFFDSVRKAICSFLVNIPPEDIDQTLEDAPTFKRNLIDAGYSKIKADRYLKLFGVGSSENSGDYGATQTIES